MIFTARRNRGLARVGLTLAVFVAGGLAASDAFAWTVELKRAALRVQLGTATEAERLLVIRNNDVINRMASTGHMPDRVYQSAQKAFADFNARKAAEAAARNGLVLKVQPASGPPKPGTDSDYIASSKSGKMTVDQVRGAIADYNAEMNRAFGTQGVDYAKKLNTDIMANPRQMSAQEFAEVRTLNNDAYGRVAATEYEIKVHDAKAGHATSADAAKGGDPFVDKPPPPAATAEELLEYKREMRDLIAKKSHQIEELQTRVTEAFKADPHGVNPETLDLQADLQIRRQQQAKYMERFTEATRAAAERWGLTAIPAASTLPKAAGDRAMTPDGVRSQAEIAADKAAKTRGFSSVEGHVEQSIRVQGAVTDAGAAAKAKLERLGAGLPDHATLLTSAAEQAVGLPLARQGEVIEQVRALHGEAAARDLAERLREMNAVRPPPPEPPTGAPVEWKAKAMKALDIMAIAGTANEIRSILKGEKTNHEIAETTLNMVSMGLYSAGQSLNEWKKIGEVAEKTLQVEKEARIYETARDLARLGVPIDRIRTVVADMGAGSEASLDAVVQDLAAGGRNYEKRPPAKPMTFEELSATGWFKSTAKAGWDVVTGTMIEPLNLIWNTGKDISEVTIDTSDFEKAMGDVSDAELLAAEKVSELGAMKFVEKLVSMGADAAEAKAAVDLWFTGNPEGLIRLRRLRDRLKEAGKPPPPPPEPSAEELSRRRAHVVDRLAKLDHAKLQATLKAVGVVPPEDFYHCLCRSAGYGSSSTRQFYHPDTIGAFNPAHSCAQPGDPCIVDGYGCTRHPLPSSSDVWKGCMEDNRIGTEKTADGKTVPKTGETLDAVIEKAIRNR